MRKSLSAVVGLAVAVTLVATGCSSESKKEPNKSAPPAPVGSATDTSAAPAPAETPKAATRELPFNPYAHVGAGDWYCALVKARYDGKVPADARPAQSVWCWTGAAETDADKAVIAFDTKPAIASVPAAARTWSKKEAPKPEDYFGGVKPEEITDWKCEDEKKTVGEKEFDCKKVTVTLGTDSIVVWLCAEVPVTGIVAMTMKSDLGGGSAEIIEIEAAGFKSTEPQAAWGKTLEELEKALTEGK